MLRQNELMALIYSLRVYSGELIICSLLYSLKIHLLASFVAKKRVWLSRWCNQESEILEGVICLSLITPSSISIILQMKINYCVNLIADYRSWGDCTEHSIKGSQEWTGTSSILLVKDLVVSFFLHLLPFL